MNKRFGAAAILVAAVAAAAGLFARPSNGASGACSKPLCVVSLTPTGPSPSTLTAPAASDLEFDNTDSVAHTVAFANGICSFTLNPGEEGGPGVWITTNGASHPACPENENFTFFVGSYPYTVDGKFTGTVVTTPLHRSVSLTARTHTIRHGIRLTLHGVVKWFNYNPMLPREQFRVIVLARRGGSHAFEPITTGRLWSSQPFQTGSLIEYGWKLKVRPGVKTTYIAEVKAQPWIWGLAKSRPFTVRTSKGEDR
jgi:hypothetical protein